MAKALIRQKENVVKPQIVAGREFKGTSFISKPEAIIFKVSFNLYQTETIILIDIVNVTAFAFTNYSFT